MKKLILAILATGAIASANAQAGSILVYGNAGYASTTDTMKGNQRNWNVNPGVGYQINNCITVGLNFGFGETSYKSDAPNADRTIVNNYEVGPFVRFAHSIAHSRIFSYYSQLNLGYMGGYTTMGSAPSFDKYSGFSGSIFPAIGANVGHNWALNFSIGGISYANTSYTGESNHLSSFNVTLGQQVNIGVSKNFTCGHKAHAHHEAGEDMHRERMDKDSDNDNGDDSSDSNSGKKHHHKKSKDTDDNDN